MSSEVLNCLTKTLLFPWCLNNMLIIYLFSFYWAVWVYLLNDSHASNQMMLKVVYWLPNFMASPCLHVNGQASICYHISKKKKMNGKKLWRNSKIQEKFSNIKAKLSFLSFVSRTRTSIAKFWYGYIDSLGNDSWCPYFCLFIVGQKLGQFY